MLEGTVSEALKNAMFKVELAPLVHQSLKAQRRFGALAVVLSLEP